MAVAPDGLALSKEVLKGYLDQLIEAVQERQINCICD